MPAVGMEALLLLVWLYFPQCSRSGGLRVKGGGGLYNSLARLGRLSNENTMEQLVLGKGTSVVLQQELIVSAAVSSSPEDTHISRVSVQNAVGEY